MSGHRDVCESTVTVNIPRDSLREERARQIVAAYLVRLKRLVRAVLNERIRRKEGTTAIVQEALASFFARDPDLSELDGVWPLLAAITRHKALHTARRYTARRRAVVREIPISALAGESSVWEFWERIGGKHEPAPADAVILIEIIESLPDEQRRLLELLLQGTTKAELAAALDRSQRSIERMIKVLRETLLNHLH